MAVVVVALEVEEAALVEAVAGAAALSTPPVPPT